jgi:hypothetical protein
MYGVPNNEITKHPIEIGEYLVWESQSPALVQLADGCGRDRGAVHFVFRMLALLMVMHLVVAGR